MARAIVGVGTGFGAVQAAGSRIEIEGSAGQAKFFSGRSPGLSERQVNEVIRRHAKHATEESVRVTEEAVKADVKARSYQSGEFYRDIHSEVHGARGDYVGSVSSDVIQARVLEEGSGIYGPKRRLIRPRPPRKYMRFPNRSHAGRPFIYAKTVKGTRPRRHFARAARETRPVAIRLHKLAAREAAFELRAMSFVK